MDFWRFRTVTQVYVIHKVEPRNYHYVHFDMTNKGVVAYASFGRVHLGLNLDVTL